MSTPTTSGASSYATPSTPLPQAEVPRPVRPSHRGPERRLYWAVVDCVTIVRRDLTYLVKQPSIIVWQLVSPVMFVLLFVFVFGSAMSVGGDSDYKMYAMPGMFAMTMAFGFVNTAMAVVVDKDRGVIDRFRSMPMAPSAVVTGRGVADVLKASLDLVVLALIALAIGWSSGGGLLETLAAFGLLLLLRFSLIWVGVLLGLHVPNQEAAGNFFALAFPFGMLSSVFTPPSMMPDWLGPIAMWNPVSSTANGVRELFGQPNPDLGTSWIEQNALLMSVVWPLAITAVFLPLAIRKFQSLSR